MGKIVLAAKITHVPTIWLSEHVEKHKGIRQSAIDGLRELGRRAAARGVDTFVVFDSHWIVNQGFHLNASARLKGRFTSHELPHFLFDMDYDYRGDADLARLIEKYGNEAGLKTLAHDVPGLGFEYGTLIPMHHMNRDARARVLSVACDQFADVDENRRFGAAVAEAVRASDRKVALLASGSLSHQFWPNALSAKGLNTVNGEFNRQVDLRVLELWESGRIREFLDMLPDYAERCHGEVRMADTAMLFGALGWDSYNGKGEILTPYFGSSGTGQCNVEFPVT
ncbi:MAG: 3,4-dihydroxyphenylacetate 2,3-dioxygenase [Alphaproteobacteria bacterium]|nr:MAG: 3,4-dihydroxyphenylacetate 2,3-dioxygenase [Alphaproteobacteria bacterium]